MFNANKRHIVTNSLHDERQPMHAEPSTVCPETHRYGRGIFTDRLEHL